MKDGAPEARWDFRLVPPVAFYPDVAASSMIPVALDPVGMSVGWFNVGSWDPDVSVAIPPVIAVVPGPAGVLVGYRGDDFVRSLRGSDTNNDLGLCNACSK